MRSNGDMSRKKVDPSGQPSFVGEVELEIPRALNHRVVGICHLGCGLFLCFLGGAGYYINYFAFAVEGDNLYHIFFEAAVCVEGDTANVCHDFEVFEGLKCEPRLLIFTVQSSG